MTTDQDRPGSINQQENGTITTGHHGIDTAELADDKTPLTPVAHQYYTLPMLRYTNFVRALIMVDGIVSVVLWLTGENALSMSL